MKAPTVAKNTFYLYVMTAAKFVLPLIITAWLTRRLGPDSYGVISYLTPVMGYFTLLFDFGFNFSATKKISQHKDDKQLIEKTISAVYTAKLLLTLVGVLLLAAMSLFVEIIREHLLLTILYYISTAAQIFIPDFLYRGLEKMEGVTTRYIIAKLVSAVLILVTVRNDDVLLLVPVAYLTGTVVAAVYTNRHMVRGLGFRMSLSGIGEAIAELKEATVYFVSTFASTALSVTSTFVMGVVGMEPAQIAYWSVAFQVIQAVQAMYDPITTSVYPHVAEKKNHKLVLRLTAYLLPVVAAGCAALFWLANTAVTVIAGSEYLAAVPVLQTLIPVLFFSFIAQMFGFPLLGAMGKERQTSWSILAAGGIQIAGLVLLALTDTFRLSSLAILRNITEFILAALRTYYVCILLKELKHTAANFADIHGGQYEGQDRSGDPL